MRHGEMKKRSQGERDGRPAAVDTAKRRSTANTTDRRVLSDSSYCFFGPECQNSGRFWRLKNARSESIRGSIARVTCGFNRRSIITTRFKGIDS